MRRKKGGPAFLPGSFSQGLEVGFHVFPGNLLVFRFSVPALRLLPGGGRRCVDAAKLLGRVFAIDVPDVFQKRDDVRFLFQRGLAAAGVFNDGAGRLVLVFVMNGGEHRPAGPCFRPFVDQEIAVMVQVPPVRQNDQVVQFDGRERKVFCIRLLNEPVAELLRGSVVCHAEMGCPSL